MDFDKNCVFCQKKGSDILIENDLAKSFLDFHPVSKGHTLITPKRHVKQVWDLSPDEMKAIQALVEENKKRLDNLYHPDGYNIAVNAGAAAGQSVFHCHIHLIPRYWDKDVKRNPVPAQFLVPKARPNLKNLD